jgi:hypothetical protein
MNIVRLAQILDDLGDFELSDRITRIAGVLDELHDEWRRQIDPNQDRRYTSYLAQRLKNVPPQNLDEYLRSLSQNAPAPDPFAYQSPSRVIGDWHAFNAQRGGFDLTQRPLERTVDEARAWGSTFSEIRDDLQDGWSAERVRDKKTLQRLGEDLDNCVEKGHHIDEVQRGEDQIWVVRDPQNLPKAMIRVNHGTITDVRGQSNYPPDDETKAKIAEWMQKHPHLSFHGYVDPENEPDFQLSKRMERQFIDMVKQNITRLEPFLEYFTAKIVGMIAPDLVKRRDEIDPDTFDFFVENYPRQMGPHLSGTQ